MIEEKQHFCCLKGRTDEKINFDEYFRILKYIMLMKTKAKCENVFELLILENQQKLHQKSTNTFWPIRGCGK